jgi:hypothetical protein
MTRAHVRLLGPCFKTGRVGRPVLPPQTGAGTAREAPRRQRQPGRGGQVRTTTRDRTLARGTSASYESHAGLFRFQDRRAVGLDTGTPHLSRETRARPPGFRPTPNGSRRATREEVRNPTGAQTPTVGPPQEPDKPEAEVYPTAAGGQWTIT